VPEGAVWFTCLSAGGVPEDAADWSDNPVAACVEAAWGCSADAAGLVTADWAEELPESDVQPATKIPAMRIAEATNMMMMLLFMGYVSLLSGHQPDVPDLESSTGTLLQGAGPVPGSEPSRTSGSDAIARRIRECRQGFLLV
jgi:hypothetical protein